MKSSFYYIDKNLSYYLIHDASKSGSGLGFENFRPEWEEVCRRYLRKAGLYQKLLFYKNFYLKDIIKSRDFT
jgi:hypothetical protein